MEQTDWLIERFEASRTHLRAVAYRMLGSYNEADDAVQETWLRLDRADSSGVENLDGWLTTIVARVCLDRLRSRRSRREEPLGAQLPELLDGPIDDLDPAHQALMADSIGPALLVVLDLLGPAERVAFVLHDIFAVPFDEISQIVGRSPDASRQLASRARRRVQGTTAVRDPDLARQREVVDAFLAASRTGDFDALLAMLDPGVFLRADDTAVRMGATREVHGAVAVASTFSGRAQAAQPALVNGAAGFVWAPGGQPQVVFDVTISNGRIVAIDQVADRERITQIEVVFLDN